MAKYASKYYDPVKAHEYYMKHRKLKGRKKGRKRKVEYVNTEKQEAYIKDLQGQAKNLVKESKKLTKKSKSTPKGKAGKAQREKIKRERARLAKKKDKLMKQLRSARASLTKTRKSNAKVIEKNRQAIQKARNKLRKTYGDAVLSKSKGKPISKKKISSMKAQLLGIKDNLTGGQQ